MKKVILMIMALCIVFSFTACGRSGSSAHSFNNGEYDFVDENDPGDSEYDVQIDTSVDNGSPIEYIKNEEDGIFKVTESNGELYYTRTIGKYSAYNKDFGGYSLRSGTYNGPITESDIVYFDRNKDSIALKGSTFINALPVPEVGWTMPYDFGVYDGSVHYFQNLWGGTGAGSNRHDIEEINGEDPSNYVDKFTGLNSGVYVAEQGETINIGYFEGTDYVEQTVTADLFYFVRANSNYEINLDVTPTKDGYFLADISSLSPGYYSLVANYYAGEMLICVK